MSKRRKHESFSSFEDAFAGIYEPAAEAEQEPQESRRRGIIYKWFGPHNYGFITDLTVPFFFHRTGYIGQSQKIYTGTIVEFDAEKNDKGEDYAANVLEVEDYQPFNYKWWRKKQKGVSANA